MQRISATGLRLRDAVGVRVGGQLTGALKYATARAAFGLRAGRGGFSGHIISPDYFSKRRSSATIMTHTRGSPTPTSSARHNVRLRVSMSCACVSISNRVLYRLVLVHDLTCGPNMYQFGRFDRERILRLCSCGYSGPLCMHSMPRVPI